MIQAPDLEIRNEDRLAAEAIARISGGLTADIVNAQIRERQELLKLIAEGIAPPVCPELTNANPSSPHTVLIEAFAWALAQQAHRFNQVPTVNLVAFANLFGIVPRVAAKAETTLTFAVNPPTGTNVTVPAGTQVATTDGKYVFETITALVINYPAANGSVKATRTVTGHTLLQPSLLTNLLDPISYVTTVTNASAVDSGNAAETLESVLERVKRYQRRGERLVSTKDLEDAIADEAMSGNGVVRAFPFIKNGDFLTQRDPIAGHTTCVVMTKTGDVIDSITRNAISALLDTAVGNQFVYIANATFVNFNVAVNIELNTASPQGTVVANVEKNLRAFYAASRSQFGRPILRSEIIAVIECTEGVDRIVPPVNSPPGDGLQIGAILIAPLVDTRLEEFKLPKLVNVTINVV